LGFSFGQTITADMGIAALVTTTLWIVLFIFVALAKFERMEF